MRTNLIAVGDWRAFVTLKDETLLMVIRSHPFTLVTPIVILSIFVCLFIASSYIIFGNYFSSFSLFIATTLLLISVSVGIVTKIIIDWYFHVFILTTRKMLEVQYTPLTSYVLNDVMLDRVLCTEIDLHTNGWIHDLIDMGDIIITFDRPTHQEDFILKDVAHCHSISNFLTQQLMDGNTKEYVAPIWYPAPTWSKK